MKNHLKLNKIDMNKKPPKIKRDKKIYEPF